MSATAELPLTFPAQLRKVQSAGEVIWMGPLVALTHTQCQSCGGRNCQCPEPLEDDQDVEGGEE